MAYKSGHIYLIDHEPIGSELATFSKPVQFDICVNGLFHSVIYDKNGNRFIEDRSKIVTGFIKVGAIVQNENQISIGVHPSGFNHWRIGGQDITTNQASFLECEPVADGEFRTDFIVGNSAGGIFILPGEAGKFPIKPNQLNYPQLAFLTEVLITPDGLSGGITLIYTTETMTGNGEIENRLDVVEASAEKRGTMSATHFSKLENINMANYMPTSHAANGITNQNINNWNTGYGWGNHANAGYALITDVNGKLDKTLATAQSVLSSVTFSGNVSTPKVILSTQVSNTTVSALWSDGASIYFNGTGGTPKQLMFDESGSFTGTVIPLNFIAGTFQTVTPNSSTNYTTTNLKRGGWAMILINAASEPTVTGATKIAGSTFIMSTNMYLLVRYNGNTIEFFFSKI